MNIYPANVWMKYKVIYRNGQTIIDDGSDYFLQQIHKWFMENKSGR